MTHLRALVVRVGIETMGACVAGYAPLIDRPTVRPSQSQPAFASEAPLDTAAVAHGAGDVLADTLIEDRLPRYEVEAEAPVINKSFDHGETPAGETGRADEGAADIFADRPSFGPNDNRLLVVMVDPTSIAWRTHCRPTA